MRILYHFPLCPFSRKVRVLLKEKELPFDLVMENFWERRKEFMAMSPGGEVPVLVEEDELILSDSHAIAEFLEETYTEANFIGATPMQRMEVRRLVNWFDRKFYSEVTQYLLGEKVMKCLKGAGEPNSNAIRAARYNIRTHLDYIGYLTKNRKWLAGDHFSLADITAAAQLSVLDYLDDVPWEKHVPAKEWYALVKSRPSFRPLLMDRIPGFRPPSHYPDPDF